MLLWLPPPNAPRSGFDEDEKAAKLIRRARAKYMNMLLAAGLVLTVLSVMIVKMHHSPKMRGAYRNKQLNDRQKGVSLKDAALLPKDSIYRLNVENQEGKLTSLMEYTGLVTLVVNTACK